MQTCSKCQNQSPDYATRCINCQSDLNETSNTAMALKRFQNNERVISVRVAVAIDCCPACRDVEGTYPKDEAPRLPVKGCSHPLGCRCFHEPALNTIFP